MGYQPLPNCDACPSSDFLGWGARCFGSGGRRPRRQAGTPLFDPAESDSIAACSMYLQQVTDMYIYIYMHIIYNHIRLIHTCMYACMHAYLPTYVRTYMHTYVRTYIHTYMRACMHTDIHTYMHAYIHITHLRNVESSACLMVIWAYNWVITTHD